MMTSPIDDNPAPGDDPGAPVGRRIVIGMVGLGVLGVAFGQPIASVLSRVAQADPTGITNALPATGGFRYYSVVSQDPVVSVADYRLEVSGLVTTPRTFTFADLNAMAQTNITKDFQCVTGWRVPNVSWSGVLLVDLLDAVGLLPEARAVTFTSFDGAYTESLTLDQARRNDTLIATSLQGEQVSNDHGGPVRLYVAAMYAYKSLKWLSGITVTPEVEPGYWEQRGYDTDAWVGGSNGRNDAPTA